MRTLLIKGTFAIFQMNHKVFKGKTIEGVCAQRFHTVVYTKDAIYTFGLNAGQLGRFPITPEQLASIHK